MGTVTVTPEGVRQIPVSKMGFYPFVGVNSDNKLLVTVSQSAISQSSLRGPLAVGEKTASVKENPEAYGTVSSHIWTRICKVATLNSEKIQ